MVNKLEFLCEGSLVDQLIRDLKGIRTSYSRNFCYEFELGPVEEFFIYRAPNANTMWWFRIDNDLIFGCGNILDLSVKSKVECLWITGVINEFVRSWMSGKFEATPNHPFIKSFEPTESASAFEIDVGLMNDFLYW